MKIQVNRFRKVKLMAIWNIRLFMLACSLFSAQPSFAGQDIDLNLLQGIPNVVFLREDVVGGGTPSQEALAEVKRQGFKSVIDLRTMIEGTVLEQASVEKLGIKYFNIPVRGSDISEEQVYKLEQILADPDNKPALLHCAVGGRVYALWQRYRSKD
jgi:uncharacterized protein (TIGR01244 family)